MKAFYPSKPFPLLHIDTTWKFRDMYAFRDQRMRELGVELIVYANPEAARLGINPFTHDSAVNTDVWETHGPRQAIDKYGFDLAFGGAAPNDAAEMIVAHLRAAGVLDPL